MFCTNCGKEIKAGSNFCENCGAAVTGQPASTPAPEQPKTPAVEQVEPTVQQVNPSVEEYTGDVPGETGNNRAGQPPKKKNSLIGIIAICAVVFLLFKGCGAILGGSGASDSTIKANAQAIVKEQLKAPSTAKFSSVEIEDKDEYGRYLVTLTVDAQNSFGAMVRGQYAVVLRIEGKRYYYSPTWAASTYESGTKAAALKLLKAMNNWGKEPASD